MTTHKHARNRDWFYPVVIAAFLIITALLTLLFVNTPVAVIPHVSQVPFYPDLIPHFHPVMTLSTHVHHIRHLHHLAHLHNLHVRHLLHLERTR